MDTKTIYWINSAAYDIEAAKAMYNSKMYLYVGFLCHQTIEKALKAIISSTAVMPTKIHNLIRLANQSNIFDKMSFDQQVLLNRLNPLNIESRYPSEMASINALLNDSTCDILIIETEDLLCWIKKQLEV
jgi:HEPN domain-containing protein